MRRPTSRNPLFHRRRFADDVIILCVRWYLRLTWVSYCDTFREIMA
jgi:transposase-like protein